jgi:hypothetical protein
VTLDVQRCRNELDELETELDHWTEPGAPGLDLWRHKMHALIGEILDPNHSLAIRLVGLTDRLRGGATRPGTLFRAGYNPGGSTFAEAKRAAAEIIEALRWELDRLAPATAPFSHATVDPELWGHVQGLVDAGDWEKVAREAAVFVEDKLRIWALVPPSVTGSVNVFKAAIGGPNGFTLPKAGPSSEQQGWQQLVTGFALALRNPSGHQVSHRSDAERYALGVLGMASLLLTEIRHEYGDPPKP